MEDERTSREKISGYNPISRRKFLKLIGTSALGAGAFIAGADIVLGQTSTDEWIPITVSGGSGLLNYIIEADEIRKISGNGHVLENTAIGVIDGDQHVYEYRGDLIDFNAEEGITVSIDGKERTPVEIMSIACGGLNKSGSSPDESSGGSCGLNPNAILSLGFEDSSYTDKFSIISREGNLSLASNEGSSGSNALQINFPEGSHYGADLRYTFSEEGMNEPEELYAQYSIKFGENWRADRNGKLPGFGGTYREAGWGGRPSNGTNGWSARGIWREGSSPQKTKLGYYVYHADMSGQYGSEWIVDKELDNGKWYCVKQHIKLNTPGENDGVLQLWIDGEKVFEKTDIRFRDTRDLKIHEYWANFYYGGTWSAPSDMDVYIDNLVVQKDPI